MIEDQSRIRPRRIRSNPRLRNQVRETSVHLNDLVLPLFVVPGEGVKDPLPTLPGHFHFSADQLLHEVDRVVQTGIRSFLLFGLPEQKTQDAALAWHKEGSVQSALRLIKNKHPEVTLMTDVCLCSYTLDGHCELTGEGNDLTCEALAKVACSHAEAGADVIAPSDMMDGRVRIIRARLNKKGFAHIPIMSYAAKYASSFYGPFREVADSTPKQGDRKGYQMDPANIREALLEVELDIREGADMILVKPALSYLDVISKVRQSFKSPLVAYQVSGTYAMVKAAAEKGWVDEDQIFWEMILSIKRAGADMIITYAAENIARRIADGGSS